MEIAGRCRRQPIQGSSAAGEQREGETSCIHIVLVLSRTVAANLFFVGKAQTVFAVEVPGVAGKVAAGAVAAERYVLFDALVLGAVDKGQCAIGGIGRAGADGAGFGDDAGVAVEGPHVTGIACKTCPCGDAGGTCLGAPYRAGVAGDAGGNCRRDGTTRARKRVSMGT